MVIAYVGLGSNLGNKKKNITKAVQLISHVPGIHMVACSRLYKTKPMYEKKQPDFINGVVKIKTRLKAEQLLKSLKEIERALGRRVSYRYGPRAIDLDVLLYGKNKFKKKSLIIPHKRMHERMFVLKPLVEISPGAVHPGFHRRCAGIIP
ncbi:MAG: 2-amino-4-hydroxy-6-hydroxymethyldihydropteridine diphosphokinase [bacterium]